MAESEEGRPVETTAPEAEPKVEDKWTGKSPDELVSMLKNQESMISKQGNDIGELRNEITRSRDEQRLALEQDRRLREYAQPAQAPQQPSYVPPDEKVFDYEKPVSSVRQVFQSEWEAREAARQRYEQQMNMERAQTAYVRGRDRVFSRKDPLYEGIESKVESLVQQTYMGGKMSVDDLKDEETWETAAQIIRVRNKEFDKLIRPKTQPVSAPFGEVSAQTKDYGGGGTTPEFDEASDAMIRNLGAAAGIKTREQAAELLRGGKGRK
jgi:hypothetical protein